jgi:hypothetical protein
LAAKIQCPACKTVSSLPDAYLGRKVKCKACGGQFTAAAQEGLRSAEAVGPAAVSGVVTVVARRVVAAGPSAPVRPASRAGWRRAAWLAGLALFLPLAAAAVVAAVFWARRGQSELYGSIEVGSAGVKYACFEIFPKEGVGYDYHVVAKDSTSIKLVAGLKEKGRFDADALRKTVQAVRTFHDRLVKEYKVPPDKVYVMVSGGLEGAIARAGPPEAERNRKELADAVEKEVGKRADFLDLQREARCQIEGIVPRADLDSSLLLDVGAGGTRGGYRESSGVLKDLEAPGVRGFLDEVKRAQGNRPGESFASLAAELAEANLNAPLREKVAQEPGLVHDPKKIYLVGGIVWVMAAYRHPSDRGNYVELSENDIPEFADAVAADPDCLNKFEPPAGLDDAEREKMKKEIRDMRKRFNGDELVAGAAVLRALAAELKFKNDAASKDDKKRLIFYRHGDIASLMESVAEKAGAKQ